MAADHARARVLREGGAQVLEQVREGQGVVVDEGADGAARRRDAGVARVGETLERTVEQAEALGIVREVLRADALDLLAGRSRPPGRC